MSRSTAVAAATALAGLVAGTGVVQMAEASTVQTSNGWRVIATHPKSELRDVAPVSSSDVWAIGQHVVPGQYLGPPLVRHWDGRSWREVTLPASVNKVELTSVSATSASNVWVTGRTGTTTAYGLHWNGRHWQVSTRRTYLNAGFAGYQAISANDVWYFSRVNWNTPDVLHFNGKRWSKVAVPGGGITSISVVSSRSIWASGWKTYPNGAYVPAILHWNGKSWHIVRTYSSNDGHAVVAQSDTSVWAVGRVVLEHFNGKTWRSIPVGVSTMAVWTPTSDGAGGLWMQSGRDGVAPTLLRYHAGRWTQRAIPSWKGHPISLHALANLRGTTTVFGVGADWGPNGPLDDVVLKFGN